MSCVDLDIGGPDFIYGPPALVGPGGRYRYPVELDRLPPAALRPYRLIVTRRDPTAARPPSAYSLLWRGTYYEVWGRRPAAPAAIADVALSGSPTQQCARIGRLVGLAGERASQAHRGQIAGTRAHRPSRRHPTPPAGVPCGRDC